MKGLFIPEITAEMFRNGCLESIEALMAEGEIFDIDYSRWIPVSEKLPENEQKVLFCTKQGNIHQGTYYADSKWYSSIRSTWIYFDSILAWMPLPEPYKTKKEAEA